MTNGNVSTVNGDVTSTNGSVIGAEVFSSDEVTATNNLVGGGLNIASGAVTADSFGDLTASGAITGATLNAGNTSISSSLWQDSDHVDIQTNKYIRFITGNGAYTNFQFFAPNYAASPTLQGDTYIDYAGGTTANGDLGQVNFRNFSRGGGETALQIDDRSNVGIGITLPTAHLEISSSTPGMNQFQIIGASSLDVFTINKDNHIFSSTTAPTVSSGIIDGTDQDGRVSGCTSACTVTFNKAYAKVPHCIVIPEAGSITNTFSFTPSTGSIVVTETGLGTFDYICRGK